jgi:hypothetical protein
VLGTEAEEAKNRSTRKKANEKMEQVSWDCRKSQRSQIFATNEVTSKVLANINKSRDSETLSVSMPKK